MVLSALRVVLLGVVAVVPAVVTAFAVSRPVVSERSVTVDSAPAVEVKPALVPAPIEARPPVEIEPTMRPRRPVTRAKIATHIAHAATRYRMSEELVAAVIAVESEFNPRAVSRRGARGLMQLMPDTAAMLGVRDPFDPRQNIDGGARYLKDLMRRFDDDLPLALAAYNAGIPAVVTHGGVPPFPETREFVRRVLARLDADGDAVAAAPAVWVVRLPARTRVALAVPISESVRGPRVVTADVPRQTIEPGDGTSWVRLADAFSRAAAPEPRRDDTQAP